MSGSRSTYLEIRDQDRISDGSDGIRIGSESCSMLLPSTEIIHGLSKEKDPGSLSLVTPVSGPDEITDVLGAIKTAAAMGWGEVVVNDWGVLSEVADMEGIGITAGRLLMRFRRGPGVFDPWDELDPATRRYFAWGPLYDSPFLAFLMGKRIGRIELDPPRHWLPLPEVDGFRFSLHRDTRLISVSGACPWLYDKNKNVWKPLKNCGKTCAGQGDIVMTSTALKGPLLLRGRAILERVDLDMTEVELPDTVDRVIYDIEVSDLP